MKTLTKWRLLMSLRGTLIVGSILLPIFILFFLPLIIDSLNGDDRDIMILFFFVIYPTALILNFSIMALFYYNKDSVVRFLRNRIKIISEKRQKASDAQMDLELSRKLYRLYSALSKIKRDC